MKPGQSTCCGNSLLWVHHIVTPKIDFKAEKISNECVFYLNFSPTYLKQAEVLFDLYHLSHTISSFAETFAWKQSLFPFLLSKNSLKNIWNRELLEISQNWVQNTCASDVIASTAETLWKFFSSFDKLLILSRLNTWRWMFLNKSLIDLALTVSENMNSSNMVMNMLILNREIWSSS